jgi:hypothetical protein
MLESVQRYREVGVQDCQVDFPCPSCNCLLQARERFVTEGRLQVQA